MRQEGALQGNTGRKKVLFLITKATWGGAQRYVYDLATNLPKDRFEPLVAFGQTGKLSKDLAVAGIRTIQLSALTRDVAFLSDIKSFFQIWNLLKNERPDIVHLNSSKAAALGAFAAELLGIKRIVFTAHGWPFKEDRNPLAKEMIRSISWFTVFLSDATIVVSKEDEGLARQMPGIARKVIYIPLGIMPPEFMTRENAADALSLSENPWPRIVTNAELTPNKGIRYAIEAVALLKERGIDVSYYLISDGEERARLVAFAEKLQVADRIHFLGFVADAARYLKAFDIFLLPSVKEGMPYVLLEGASAGLPIITTDVIDPAFLERLPEASKVAPKDPEALAEAIVKMLKPEYENPALTLAPFSDMLAQTIELYTQS